MAGEPNLPTDDAGVERLDESIQPVESREYELAVATMAHLQGPAGGLTIRRTYEALPRHNDECYRDGADSNDGLVDRPDAIHVHTRYYRPEREGETETYFLDRHETWRLDEPGVLGDAERFLAACADHHLTDLSAEYRWATDEEVRSERTRPERNRPDGWRRLS